MVATWALAAGLFGGPLAPHAQDDHPRVAFTAVSVTANSSGSPSSSSRALPDGGFAATNVTLKALIAIAYGVWPFQLAGGPEWLEADRFDVSAHAEEGTPDSLRPAMLKALLADRFRLAVHSEMRDEPVYVLVLARADGHLGPRVRMSETSCSDAEVVRHRFAMPPACGLNASSSGERGHLRGAGMSMRDVAGALSSFAVHRTVIDRTGLAGAFDFELHFAPQGQPPRTARPALFTAVEQQLGLKLEPGRYPMQMLVVDHAARPTTR